MLEICSLGRLGWHGLDTSHQQAGKRKVFQCLVLGVRQILAVSARVTQTLHRTGEQELEPFLLVGGGTPVRRATLIFGDFGLNA